MLLGKYLFVFLTDDEKAGSGKWDDLFKATWKNHDSKHTPSDFPVLSFALYRAVLRFEGGGGN